MFGSQSWPKNWRWHISWKKLPDLYLKRVDDIRHFNKVTWDFGGESGQHHQRSPTWLNSGLKVLFHSFKTILGNTFLFELIKMLLGFSSVSFVVNLTVKLILIHSLALNISPPPMPSSFLTVMDFRHMQPSMNESVCVNGFLGERGCVL